MRFHSPSRGAHPKVRPSLHRFWPMDDLSVSSTEEFSQPLNEDLGVGLSNPSAPDIIDGPVGMKARRFDGADFWFAAGDATSKDVHEESLTLHVWVKIRDVPSSGTRIIYQYGGAAGDGNPLENIKLFVGINSNQKPRILWEYGDGTPQEDIEVDWVFPVDEWVLITVKKVDAGGGFTDLYFYVNGTEILVESGLVQTSGGDNANYTIGAQEDAGGAGSAFLVGDLAGVYLYAEALDEEEIQEDYRRGLLFPFYSRVDFRLEFEDQSGERIELTDFRGIDWVDAIRINDDIDNAVKTATVDLFREVGYLSISPLKEDSVINLSDPNNPLSYDPLLWFGKEVEVFGATVPLGIMADRSELMSLILGEVDDIDPGGDKVTITFGDQGRKLVDTYMEDEINYSEPSPTDDPPGAGPFAVETEMQQILNDNDNDAGNNSPSVFPNAGLVIGPRPGSYDPITLYVKSANGKFTPAGVDPTIVNWAVLIWRQRREPVLSSLRNLTGQIAWECRYIFNHDLGVWVLCFFEIRRDQLHPNIVLRPEEITQIPTLKITKTRVRNVWRIVYPSSETTLPALPAVPAGYTQRQGWFNVDGKGQRLQAFYQVESDASIAKHGRRFSEVAEPSATQIDTITEAHRFGFGALQDTEEPDVDKAFNLPAIVQAEIRDMVRFTPNAQIYTSAQTAGIKGYSLTLADVATSQFQAGGKPRAGFKRWLQLESRPGIASPPVALPQDALTDQANGKVLSSLRAIIDQSDYLAGGKYLQVKNSEFTLYSAGLENPPDSWRIIGGSWRTDVEESPDSNSGTRSVVFHNATGELESALIPIDGLDDTPYSFELTWKRDVVGSNVPIVDVIYYAADRITQVGAAYTLTPSILVAGAVPDFPPVSTAAGTWFLSRVDGVHPPVAGTARFIKLRLRQSGATDIHMDRVSAYRTSKASKAGRVNVAYGFVANGGVPENQAFFDVDGSAFGFPGVFYDRGKNMRDDHLSVAPHMGYYFLAPTNGTFEISLRAWIAADQTTNQAATFRFYLRKNAVYLAGGPFSAGLTAAYQNPTVTIPMINGVGQDPIEWGPVEVDLVKGDRLSVDLQCLGGNRAYAISAGIASDPSYWAVKLREID